MEGKKSYAYPLRVVRFGGRAMVGFALILGLSVAIPSVPRAEDLSPVTRGLFDSVQRNDLAGVQTSVAQGARIDAHNPFGLRPVDIAIDRGYYEIAHYLLSLGNMQQKAETPSKRPSPQVTGPVLAPPAPSAVSTAPLPPISATGSATAKHDDPSPPTWPAGRANPFDPQTIPDGARHPAIEGNSLPSPSASVPPPPLPPQAAEAPPTNVKETAESLPAPAITETTTPLARKPKAEVPSRQSIRQQISPPVTVSTAAPSSPPPLVVEQPAPVPAAPAPPIEPPMAAAPSLPEGGGSGLAEPSTMASAPPSLGEGSVPSMVDSGESTLSLAPESSIGTETAAPPPLSVVAGEQPAAPGQGGFLAEASSRIKQVTRSFDQTFDNFLGGWFFKWMGRKMGLAEEPKAPKKKTQVADSALPSVPPVAINEEPDPLKIFSAPSDGAAPTGAGEAIGSQSPSSTGPEAAAPLAGRSESPTAAMTASPSETSATPMASDSLSNDLPSDGGTTAPVSAAQSAQADAAATPDADGIALSDPMLADLPGTADPLSPSPDATAAPPRGKIPAVMPTPARPAIRPIPKPSTKVAATPPSNADRGELGAIQSLPTNAAIEASDPFAPDAVPPGALHPVIGDTAPILPELPVATKPTVPAPVSPAVKPMVSAKGAGETPTEPNRPPVSAKAARAAKASAPAKPPASGDSLENLLGQLASVPETGKAASAGTRKASGGLFGLDGPADTPAPAQPSGSGGGLFGLDGPSTTTEVAAISTAKVPTVVARQIPNTVLTLGESIHISAAMPSEAADPTERNFCIKKQHGAVAFCIEPVDWPARLAKDLQVSSIMYQGAQAIVRYDDQVATRFHAIFPTEAYSKLIAYYTKRFGKPTSRNERTIAPFAQPRQSNPAALWQRMDPLSNQWTTLEIRKYDDARGGFPDLRYGAIMLYNASSPSIFPALSTLDLMPTAAPE